MDLRLLPQPFWFKAQPYKYNWVLIILPPSTSSSLPQPLSNFNLDNANFDKFLSHIRGGPNSDSPSIYKYHPLKPSKKVVKLVNWCYISSIPFNLFICAPTFLHTILSYNSIKTAWFKDVCITIDVYVYKKRWVRRAINMSLFSSYLSVTQ